MNISRYVATACLMLIACGMAAYGQNDPKQNVESSYDISLKIILGSNEAGKNTDLGQDLSAVSRQIRSTFPFASYKLAATFVGRISNAGNYDYKSVSNFFGPETETKAMPLTFLEWGVSNFRSGQNVKGENAFQAQQLRFGAKVPIPSGRAGEQGKSAAEVSYEWIGLNLGRISFTENSPTLIGTLNLPGSDGTLFLIMTIRPA